MDRFTQALHDGLERYSAGVASEGLQAILLKPMYFELIPGTMRPGFRAQVEAVGQGAFIAGFTRRYTEAAPEHLTHVWNEQAGALTSLLGRSLRRWDAELQRQGHAATLKQRFPMARLKRELEAALREAFLEGQREGYKALKHRMAEDVVGGIPSQESLRALTRDRNAILTTAAAELATQAIDDLVAA
ncbi:MAG TPA: hypothetical protein VEI97_11145 [bacterium]|nr:hypothetical protein [bacterium]